MTESGLVRERLKELIASSSKQRVRPNEARQLLAREFNISTSTIKGLVKGMVDEGDLVYSYRDPCSYLERPAA